MLLVIFCMIILYSMKHKSRRRRQIKKSYRITRTRRGGNTDLLLEYKRKYTNLIETASPKLSPLRKFDRSLYDNTMNELGKVIEKYYIELPEDSNMLNSVVEIGVTNSNTITTEQISNMIQFINFVIESRNSKRSYLGYGNFKHTFRPMANLFQFYQQ